MSDVRNERGGPRKSPLTLAIWGVVLVGLAAFIYVIASSAFKPKDVGDLRSFRKGDLAMLEIPGLPKAKDPRLPDADPGVSPPAAPPPSKTFEGPDGKAVSIADFKGKVTVVNLWASWCAPCKVEMPTLAKLQAAYAVQPLAVVPISTDTPEDLDAAKAELAKYPPLAFYHTPGISLTFDFAPVVPGLPTTIIYDKKGVERARLSKEAHWDSPEARALIEELLKEG